MFQNVRLSDRMLRRGTTRDGDLMNLSLISVSFCSIYRTRSIHEAFLNSTSMQLSKSHTILHEAYSSNLIINHCYGSGVIANKGSVMS